jgi:hypothetical protein
MQDTRGLWTMSTSIECNRMPQPRVTGVDFLEMEGR